MSNNYFCKDCDSNNNGWCTIRKCQGLKQITSCDHKSGKPSFPVEDSSAAKEHAERILGERTMLWNIQKQVIAIMNSNDSNKFESVIAVMGTLSSTLEAQESIFNVHEYLDSGLDEDIIQDSKNMAIMLRLMAKKSKVLFGKEENSIVN